MRISVKNIAEKVIWLLTVFLFSSFLIFDTYAWGRYAFFAASILIVLLSAIIHNGIVRIRLQPFHGFFALFIVYVAITSLWALRPSDVTGKAITLAQILICAAMLYIHYDRQDNVRPLMMAVMWSGYIVVLYAIAFYGLDAMLESAQDIRLETEFANVNNIAMAAAISCMIQWNELMHKRNVWAAVLIVPSVILITATQSRKAFVLLLAGVILTYAMNMAGQKGLVKKILKLLVYLVILYVGMRLLFRLPIFAGSLERMDQMLNFWTEGGEVDHSTIMRNDMMKLGIEWWKKYPLGGVGIGCPHILAGTYLKFNAYLHNNFVELLCGGGILGLLSYYVMHIYLFVGFFKYRKADPEAFSVAIIWLFLTLIMHYGMVSYYSKLQWYYLVIHFLNLSQMKRKYMEMNANAQEPATEGN